MNDTISRAAALSVVEKMYKLCEGNASDYHDLLVACITDLTPAQRWIPCKERMPKPEEEVLLTFDYKKRRYVETGNIWSDGTAHCYADDYLTPDGRKYRKVVAWMPLPDPWKGEEHGTPRTVLSKESLR